MATPIPDDALCPQCHNLDRNAPNLRGLLETMGDDLSSTWLLCNCLERKAVELKANRESSNMPRWLKDHTLENFKKRPGTEAAYAAVMAFLDRKSPHFLTLVGTTGSGRSHLLEAIGHRVLSEGVSIRYEYTSDLLVSLRATFDRQEGMTFEEALRRYKIVPLLLLDDLGAHKATEWATDQLTAILDYRLRMGGWTVVATNLTYREMVRAGEEVGRRVGDQPEPPRGGAFRIASRLWDTRTGNAKVVTLTCGDYRTGKEW